MADEHANGQGLPPPSEAIHLPGPSYLPAVIALFTTIALVGVVVNWIVFGIAMVVVLYCILRWIADTRRDIAELPLEH
jgi:type IV secretory pathway TrbD component